MRAGERSANERAIAFVSVASDPQADPRKNGIKPDLGFCSERVGEDWGKKRLCYTKVFRDYQQRGSVRGDRPHTTESVKPHRADKGKRRKAGGEKVFGVASWWSLFSFAGVHKFVSQVEFLGLGVVEPCNHKIKAA